MGGHREPGPQAHPSQDRYRELASRVNHESILDLITTRETVAAAQAEQLREQITTLAEQLAAVETELANLATTRATLWRLTGAADDPPPADATLAGTAYQRILAVFATTESGLRAKDICHALGIGTTANHTESLRAKLKRLVARGLLTEAEPGLFTLAAAEITTLCRRVARQVCHIRADRRGPPRSARSCPAPADRPEMRPWRLSSKAQ